MRYVLYHTDGRIENVDTTEPLPLEGLQKLVGGYVESIRQPHGRVLLCNEDGRLLNLPPNATHLGLVGNVVGAKQGTTDIVGFEITTCPVCGEQFTDCDLKEFGITVTAEGCGFCPVEGQENARGTLP